MKKTASLVIIALLLVSALQIGFAPVEVGVVSARTTEGISPAYVSHNPIRIDDDTDFANQASGEGWNGSGTQSDPYIIENYDIDAHGEGNAIYLGNTTVHFLISGCYLHNASYHSYPYNYGVGITLCNVQNGLLSGNVISYNEYYGIYLKNSSGNTLSKNDASTNDQKGVYLESSEGNYLNNNTASYNNFYGFDLWYSPDNILYNNTAIVNHYGIAIYNSNNSHLLNSTLNNDYYYDIQISESANAILKNNSMSGNGVHIHGDKIEEWNTHSIDTSNTVDGRPAYYRKNQTGGSIPSGASQVILANCSSISMENLNLTGVGMAILLGFSNNNTITNNNASNNNRGIDLEYSDGNTITGNELSNNADGFYLDYSNANTLINNTISKSSSYGIYVYMCHSNILYHNNFIDNIHQAYVWSNTNMENTWNSTYPEGGNYWDNYGGMDNYSGPAQNENGSDGIGDTAYTISSDNTDHYPLMSPWGSSPKVLSTQPADLEKNVILDGNVTVVFNTTMNATVTPELRQVFGTSVTYTFVGWTTTNVVNDTATWTHDNWTDKENIGMEICNYRDASGRDGLLYSWSFTTVDITPPSLFSTDPADADSGVLPDKLITVVFDESLNTSATPQLTEITSSGVTYTFSGFTTTNVENDTATWTHGSWPEKYTVNLKVTGAQDTSGNTMVSAYYWNFTTADLTAPAVISTTPSDGETNVNKSVVITVVFSEEMNTSYNGGQPSLWFRNGTDPGGWAGLGWTSTNVNNDTYSWTHDNFTEKDRISLAVAYYADIAGNTGPTYEWTFYIEDKTSPYVNDTLPENGETGVPETDDVVAIFSESMNTSAIPTITQTGGTVVTYTFSHWATTNFDNDTAVWSHADNWTSEDTVTLEISGYEDLAGNTGTNYLWSFTVRDFEKPYVMETEPNNDEEKVSLNRTVVVVFSESMDTVATPQITQTSGNPKDYYFLGWSTIYAENDTAMWSHDDWDEKDTVTIKISGYRDLSGNYGDDYYFTFYTVDLTPPSVDSVDPQDGSVQVPYSHNITAVFSESMNISRIPILTQTSGDVVTYTFAEWGSTNVANDTAIWTHDNWTDSDTVNLIVSDYYDPAGNLGSNYTWSFRVYDATPPTITSSFPYDGEINVSVSISHVYVNFSEPMDPNGGNPTLYIGADGNKPSSSFWKWVDVHRTRAIFNITGQFSESDHVHMWLSSMQDLYNNNLVGGSWWFYTYDPVPPAVNDTNPWNGESSPDIVNKNQTVIVYFDTSLAYINTSVIPAITQKEADPGGWTFLGWDEDGAGRAMASWSHNNWTTETVNLTVSHYRDMCGNWGKAYSWEFNVSIYTSHSMIRINSDTEFADMASSEGWSGDGSAGNPYIIEGYRIGGDDGRGGYCIYIGNTTVNFIIRDNSLDYAWTDNPVYPYYPKASVVLYNVMAGSVENNSMNVQSDFGVYALETQNVIISGNYIHDYWWNGMNIKNSTLSIFNNTLAGAGNGIYLKNSPDCYLAGNLLEGRQDNTGITLENSSYAVLTWNGIVNYSSGIVFDPDDGTDVNITLENNSMENCGLMIWGWMYEHWTSHKIVNNTVNNRPLLFLNGVDDAEIGYDIHAGQIYIVDCYNISISDQFIVRATVGVYIAMSQLVEISNSTFAYNSMYAVYIIAGLDNTVIHNNFVGNGFDNGMDVQAYDDGDPGDNCWNATYYEGGGNYWDDHTSPDDNAGPNQDQQGISDGIVDNPYNIGGASNADEYPLVDPTPIAFYYTPGWHMVAFPWLVDKTSITDALSGASWDRAEVYINGTWYTYDNKLDAKYNIGFPRVDRTMGLWVNFTANSSLGGESPIHTGNITIHLYRGWNLVEGVSPLLVMEMLDGVDYRFVESANMTNSSDMEYLAPDDTMLPGRGYWIFVEKDYTITIDTDNFTVTTAQGIIPASKPAQNSILESSLPSSLSTSEASPVSHGTQSQHSQNYGLTIMLTITALGASLSTAYWIRKRRK